MNFLKSQRFSLCAVLALGCVGPQTVAQNAKSVAEQARAATDQCEQMQLWCKAADLDSKNKEYRDTCNGARGVLSRKDDTNVERSATALSSGDLSSARRFANYVCKYNVKQYDEAQDILQSVKQKTEAKNATPPPPAPTPQPQPTAPVVANNPPPVVQQQPPVQQQPANQVANNAVKPTTPTPAPQQAPPTNNANNQAKPAPAPPKPAPEPVAVTVQKLLDQAVKAKTVGNLQEARRAFAEALRLDPSNAAAMVGRGEVEARINSDPAEQAKTLAQAIRDFYSYKYQDAESGLTDYLASTTARSRGAAYFYLGATRLSMEVMENKSQKVESLLTSPNVQKSFKQARDEHYKPVERYVSPLILQAWRGGN